MEKVKLDKVILLKEKLETIWSEEAYKSDFAAIKNNMLKKKTERKE